MWHTPFASTGIDQNTEKVKQRCLLRQGTTICTLWFPVNLFLKSVLTIQFFLFLNAVVVVRCDVNNPHNKDLLSRPFHYHICNSWSFHRCLLVTCDLLHSQASVFMVLMKACIHKRKGWSQIFQKCCPKTVEWSSRGYLASWKHWDF